MVLSTDMMKLSQGRVVYARSRCICDWGLEYLRSCVLETDRIE